MLTETRPIDQLLNEIRQLDPEYLLQIINIASETLIKTAKVNKSPSLPLSPLKLSDFLRQSPLSEVELDFTRTPETNRAIEL